MKQILLAGTISLFAGAALAHETSAPAVTPEIVVEEAMMSSGSDDWIMVFLVVFIMGLGIAG